MADAPSDPRWTKILSILGHELRNPLSPMLGYLRMVEKVGPLNEKQRFMLKEVESACGRFSKVLTEISDLHKLESGETTLARRAADLHASIRTAVDELPTSKDPLAALELELEAEPAPFEGHAARMAQAIGSIIHAVRRELMYTETLRCKEHRTPRAYEFRLGTAETLAAFEREADADRRFFDEWREGVGLSLPVARRILNQHGAAVYRQPDGFPSGARIVVPR